MRFERTSTTDHPTDRVLPATRALGAVIVVALIPTLFLYLFPDRAGKWFAWPVKPDMTPLIMGAGYLCGAYYFVRVVLAKKWHHVQLGFLPISTFAAFMTVATFTHLSRFDHGHFAYWVWIFLYATTPWVIPLVWYWNRPEDPRAVEPGDVMVPRTIRTTLVAVGLGESVVAAIFLVSPSTMIDIWPWTLTPLSAQVLGGWFALPGLVAIAIGLDGRWSASRFAVHSQLIGLTLMLIGVGRAWDEYDTGNVVTYLFVCGLALQLATFGRLYLYMHGLEQRARGGQAAGAVAAAP